jgi:hypothetical protein
MTLAAWLAQARAAMNTVDAQFGEPVNLLPWQKGEFVNAGPDTTRTPIGPVTAIFKTTRSMPANVAPDMASRFSQSDAYISINEEHLTDCEFQQGDRVELVNPRADNPSGVYEANYISHTPVKRSRVFLIRIKEDV